MRVVADARARRRAFLDRIGGAAEGAVAASVSADPQASADAAAAASQPRRAWSAAEVSP